MKAFSILFIASILASACSHQDESNVAAARNGGGGRGGNKPVCTGNEPARKGAPYVFGPTGEARLAAFQDAAAQYLVDHPEAAEFGRVLEAVGSKSCFVDADCATGSDARFSASCQRYEWVGTNGSCQVHSSVEIPAPPVFVLTCADVQCPSNYQCEVENHNGAVGCVEQRSCVLP